MMLYLLLKKLLQSRILQVAMASFLLAICHGQEAGCTDPQALNYDSEASINDGSCEYPLSTYLPALMGELPSVVNETSGLMLLDTVLWTHNDSGGQAVLYGMDLEGSQIIKQVRIANASNRDWEDICRDDTYAYIGDFGNNNGNRRDLVIYKVALEDLKADTAWASVISFEYPDQRDFSSRPQNNDYDMEAMICMGDSLYLFSKNWVDQQTRLYSLPKEPGAYTAVLLDSFQVNGLITGAAFAAEDSLICLVGYTRLLSPFMWLLWDFRGHRVFSGHKRRIELGILFHQVEAVAWNPEERYFYVSNERFSNIITIPQRLYRVETDAWTMPISTDIPIVGKPERSLSIYPNPARDSIFWTVEEWEEAGIERGFLISARGAAVRSLSFDSRTLGASISLQDLSAGVYFLRLQGREHVYTAKFVVVD